MYRLTEEGRRKAEQYIRSLHDKQKEILDTGKDTADDITLPTVEAIEDDIELCEDDDGTSWNCWPVSDHYDADLPICLVKGVDYTEINGINPTEGFQQKRESSEPNPISPTGEKS